MAAPLSVYTKEEQRGVIHFLWSEGVTGAEIHRRLSDQYGDRALPWRSVYEWIEKFQHSQTSVKKKFKSQPSARKVMLTIFWDSQGVLLEHYLERAQE